MSPTPIADANMPVVARPYGLVGLILSLIVILALTVLVAVAAMALIFAGLVAVHGLQGALDLVTTMLEGTKAGGRANEGLDVVLGIGAYLAQILAVFAVARFRGGGDWSALVAWRDWAPRRHWKLFAGLMVLTLAWSIGASIAIEHVYPEAKDWVTAPKAAGWIVGFLALAVLFGPFAEELLFRGWMYTSLRASFGLRIAVLVTSVLFALAHWESTHLYALAVLPVGLALATIRERTGSIAASITFHAIYNGVASVMLFVGQ